MQAKPTARAVRGNSFSFFLLQIIKLILPEKPGEFKHYFRKKTRKNAICFCSLWKIVFLFVFPAHPRMHSGEGKRCQRGRSTFLIYHISGRNSIRNINELSCPSVWNFPSCQGAALVYSKGAKRSESNVLGSIPREIRRKQRLCKCRNPTAMRNNPRLIPSESVGGYFFAFFRFSFPGPGKRLEKA